jgi:hypothetical protein
LVQVFAVGVGLTLTIVRLYTLGDIAGRAGERARGRFRRVPVRPAASRCRNSTALAVLCFAVCAALLADRVFLIVER